MTFFRPVFRFASIAVIAAGAAGAQEDISPAWYLLSLTVHDTRGGLVSGAEVRLDGLLIGETDATGRYFLARKAFAGPPHTLSVSAQRFLEYSGPVSLPSNDDPGVRVDVQLKAEPLHPAPVEAQRGDARTLDPNCHLVRIFYVTDRQDTGNPAASLRFADARAQGGQLSRGTADISIPRDHRPGELEEPSWLHLEFRPDSARHVILQTISPTRPDAFYRQLNQRVAGSSGQDVVVFVHGFNNGFDEAARKLAQLTYDLKFDGAPILYSWPSRNSVFAYTEDEDTIQWTAFHLRAFLEELARETKAAKIHLIAHSMGSRALTSALQVIAAKRERDPKPLFDQVVLAAPDIGADTLDLLSREIRPVTRRITLYASASDDALIVSRLVHGVTRAGGMQGKYLLVAKGLDTVDASDAHTDFLGHAYFDNSATIITDIQKIVTTEAPPERRNLIPATLENLKYWRIPVAGSAVPVVIH